MVGGSVLWAGQGCDVRGGFEPAGDGTLTAPFSLALERFRRAEPCVDAALRASGLRRVGPVARVECCGYASGFECEAQRH